MTSVISFNLIQKREELCEEMAQLQEEIEILNMLLEKVRDEHSKIDFEIKNAVGFDSIHRVNIR